MGSSCPCQGFLKYLSHDVDFNFHLYEVAFYLHLRVLRYLLGLSVSSFVFFFFLKKLKFKCFKLANSFWFSLAQWDDMHESSAVIKCVPQRFFCFLLYQYINAVELVTKLHHYSIYTNSSGGRSCSTAKVN